MQEAGIKSPILACRREGLDRYVKRKDKPLLDAVQDATPKCLNESRYEDEKHLLRVAQVSGVGDCNVGSGYCN